MKAENVCISLLLVFVVFLTVFVFILPNDTVEETTVTITTINTVETIGTVPTTPTHEIVERASSTIATPTPIPETPSFEEMTDEELAAYCDMTVEEFILMSRVVEAESDRSDDMQGRIYIAETIFNRVDSSDFPNTIEGVICQSGQFEVVSNGMIYSVGRTTYSDTAIAYAYDDIQNGTAPYVLYFNNSGYQYGTPYGYFGGNYFTTGG